MRSVRTKICGITSPDDAVACHGLGADFVGVIFAESPRLVTPERALEIRRAVPDALLVGVFANAEVELVTEVADGCGLDVIQLHGDESPEYCALLRDHLRVRMVKSFRNGEVPGEEELASYCGVEYLLLDLDKSEPGANGGTDALWEEAARVRDLGHRVFLAGGLTPENVRAAVERTCPFCVDVSSGVEARPGIKDIEAVERFITEATA